MTSRELVSYSLAVDDDRKLTIVLSDFQRVSVEPLHVNDSTKLTLSLYDFQRVSVVFARYGWRSQTDPRAL